MKFISKSANLNIILRPGLPQQPITGTPATPTIFVKFQDGVANIEDEALVEMMLNHPGFNGDFVSAEEADPFEHLRPREVAHVHTEMEYGHPVSRSVSPVKPGKLPDAVSKMIRDQALDLAKQMLPELMKEALQNMKAEAEGAAEAPKAVKAKAPATKKKAPSVGIKK